MDLQSEGVNLQSEGVDLQSEGVDLQSEGVDLQPEGVVAQRDVVLDEVHAKHAPDLPKRSQQDQTFVEFTGSLTALLKRESTISRSSNEKEVVVGWRTFYQLCHDKKSDAARGYTRCSPSCSSEERYVKDPNKTT